MEIQSVMMVWRFLLMPLAAYLIGSLSFAWLAGRLNGIDLRKYGSHSLGATNAGRVLGRQWFAFVFVFDVAKGWGPVFIVDWALGSSGNTLLLLLVGASAVLGHVFTCFHNFRGGKAVATSLGVLIAVLPLVAALSFAIWLVVLLAQWVVSDRSRSDAVGPASVVAAVAAPIIHLLSVETPWNRQALPLTVFVLLLSTLIVLKHRSNIAKLFAQVQHTS